MHEDKETEDIEGNDSTESEEDDSIFLQEIAKMAKERYGGKTKEESNRVSEEENIFTSKSVSKDSGSKKIDDISEEFLAIEKETKLKGTEEKNDKQETEKKRLFPRPSDETAKKSKAIGKPVYMEDTGEKLGTISGVVYDEKNNVTKYKIKDLESDAELTYPAEQFYEERRGIIFTPGWYVKAIKAIDKLRFKEKASPELANLLIDDDFDKDFYRLFDENDDEFVSYVRDGKAIRKVISTQLNLLEKRRDVLSNKLMDFAKKRLVEDINRREFSESVLKLRQQLKLLDMNIGKCKDLLQRFNDTIFGVISDNKIVTLDDEINKIKEEKPKEEPIPYYDRFDRVDRKEPMDLELVDLIESRIIEDVKKQLLKNQLSGFENMDFDRKSDDKLRIREDYIRQLNAKLIEKDMKIKELEERLYKNRRSRY